MTLKIEFVSRISRITTSKGKVLYVSIPKQIWEAHKDKIKEGKKVKVSIEFFD